MDAVLTARRRNERPRDRTVKYVGYGIVQVSGLPNIRSDELVLFPGNLQGLVFNIDPDEIGIILLGPSEHLSAGSEVRRTGRVLDVPVGESLIGRVVDAQGRPLDNGGEIRTTKRLPVERERPLRHGPDPVTVPSRRASMVIDAPLPHRVADSGS
jgi:F-type H+-transporting ATPase subunit alpha